MTIEAEWQDIVKAIVKKGKGILAADESLPTIAKHFDAVDVDSSEENRRAYRTSLLTTSGIGE